MIVKKDARLGVAQQPRQRSLPLQEWEIAQVLAIMFDQVKGGEARGSSGLTTGQLLEPRVLVSTIDAVPSVVTSYTDPSAIFAAKSSQTPPDPPPVDKNGSPARICTAKRSRPTDQMQMGWFRRNIRVTRSFALLVLAMHFALTFGHPHVERLINPAISILSELGSADSPIEALPAVYGTSHGLPLGPSNSSDSGDYCAICANIDLASSLVSPAMPSFVVPRNGDAQPLRVFEFEPTPLDCTGFDARGPPLT